MNKRRKILLLYCGALDNYGIKDLEQWIYQMAELAILAETEFKIFYTGSTVDIERHHWIELAREIHSQYNNYDGFVILHGLDNLLFTACALSFLLQNLSKPVVFTGGHLASQPSKKSFFGSGHEAGIKANIINAVQAATFSFGEVALMFGSRLIRANQARRNMSAGVNFFEAPEKAWLGQIDFSIRLFEKNIMTHKGQVIFSDRLEEKVALCQIQPTIQSHHLELLIKNNKAVILDCAELSALPQAIEKLVSRLAKESTIALRHTDPSFVNNSKDQVIDLSAMTPEAGYVKLMFALGQNKNHREIKKFMLKNIAGELL